MAPVKPSARCVFQSTPPARGATVQQPVQPVQPVFQSTPPARGATAMMYDWTLPVDISIHAPREGGDNTRRGFTKARWTFQSTPPARGATINLPSRRGNDGFQSTPPARGATAFLYAPARHQIFQSTPPARGATEAYMQRRVVFEISIHAPREGGDIVFRHLA